jgi:hypothetical protein
MVCYSILWITGVWIWRIVGGGEDRRYINNRELFKAVLVQWFH